MKGKALIIVFVLGLIVVLGISTNNGLVEREENVESAWAQVENQYQRRADLIPNLVNTVRGAADFEQETLTAVINARSKATSVNITAADLNDPSKIAQFQEAQQQISGALSRLLVSVERYPELKANSNFATLKTQLEGTENRISTERMRFNKATQAYNTSIKKFPTSIIASISGFERKSYFEAENGAENAPTVDFSN
jgi:LemA protein